MKKYIGLLALLVAGLCHAQSEQPKPKRLYIEERVKTTTGTSVHRDAYGNCFGQSAEGSRNISLETTREVMKQCPSILTVTDNRDAAEYDLRISPGSSTLYRQNGDVAYVSRHDSRYPTSPKTYVTSLGMITRERK